MTPQTAEATRGSSTKSNVDPVPNGMHTVTPHLVCAGAADAIEFYKKAFSAVEICRMPMPDGRIMHAGITIGDSMIMLVDEMPDWDCLGPNARGGSSVTIHLQVENADALFEQAVKTGATVKMPIADAFWGDRYGIVVDPFGHSWSIATHIRDVSPEEMMKASQEMECCGQKD
ncbi:MAG: VOC family protein [Verrucomicrobiota bacterium]